jgi:hypothetical protein
VSAITLCACSRESLSEATQPETNALRSELESLGDKAKQQSLQKEIQAIKECRIDGSVFIVTKGGTNYKLGLVPVSILSKREMQERLDAEFDNLRKVIAGYSQQYLSSSLAIKRELQTSESGVKEFMSASDEYNAALSQLKGCASVYDTLHRIHETYGQEVAYQAAGRRFLAAKVRQGQAARKLESVRKLQAAALNTYKEMEDTVAVHMDVVSIF